MEDAERTWVENVGNELALNQARFLATNYILMEVVRTMAESSDNPKKLLTSMFENISVRIDQTFAADDTRVVATEIRDIADRFFVNAGKGII